MKRTLLEVRTARRSPIPRQAADEVLFWNSHTCCICNTPHKDVQIHHIDGNPRNNHSSNLAVVCLDCHSKVTGTRGLGRAFSAAEVRRYKRSWEQKREGSRKVHEPDYKTTGELVAQVDIIVCEILASRSEVRRVEMLLDMLFELHLWRGNRQLDRRIVAGLHHLARVGGLSSPKLAQLVTPKLWEMCFRFVGPSQVPMNKQDLKQVFECINALTTLARVNCEIGRNAKTLAAIVSQAENFFDLGLIYRRREVTNKVIGLYRVMKSCYARPVDNLAIDSLRRSAGVLLDSLQAERPKWSYQIRQLTCLVAP